MADKNEKNNNITDYLFWRGDIPFSFSPFNEVDALILSQLSYLHFDNLVPSTLDKTITLKKLAKEFKESDDFEIRKNNGPLI
ncbi:MAG: hypothetical protein K5839_01480, partial [Treponemataceae bacterium]|nr:hypothetical protein [Treponemataceae bacterium]